MSFGGGDEPSNTSFQTQYSRDAPQIEAAKLGLMDTAKQYTMFGMNPWEAVDPKAKPGETGFGEYGYKGTDGRYALDTKFGDLTREQRMKEGQVDIPGQKVAGFDPMQQKAFQMADAGEGGIGGYKQYLDQAKGYAQDATQAYDPSSYKEYMNPYQDEVIASIEDQYRKQRNEAAGKAGSAFGSERYGVLEGELGSQQAKAVGQAQAQNYGQAQQAAIGQFQNQMGRYGEAAQQMAGLGGQAQQQAMSDIGGLMSAGSVQQQNLQQQYDADFQQKMQQLYEPYQRMGFTSDIYQGNIPSSAMATAMGTAPGSNPLAQTVGAGIAGLAAYQGFNK